VCDLVELVSEKGAVDGGDCGRRDGVVRGE
jgi:hypothetical protein